MGICIPSNTEVCPPGSASAAARAAASCSTPGLIAFPAQRPGRGAPTFCSASPPIDATFWTGVSAVIGPVFWVTLRASPVMNCPPGVSRVAVSASAPVIASPWGVPVWFAYPARGPCPIPSCSAS